MSKLITPAILRLDLDRINLTLHAMDDKAPSHKYKAPTPGVWAPAVTLFDHETDSLDITSQNKYYSYLSQTGLTGLVILGTNAETFLLTREERAKLLVAARASVPANYPLIAGVGGHSTKQVLEYISDAHAAKADYVLVLPPAYFGKQTTNKVIERFFDDVATASPLPIVIYNFPGVCNGVDMDSELMTKLAQRHENIVGVKLTCASVGKITRLAATFPLERFAVFGGQSDFLLGGMAVGSAGCIAAFGNVAPKTLARIYELWEKGERGEALRLHQIAALAENPCKAGIAAVKYAASLYSAAQAGIEGAETKMWPRQPYEPLDEAAKKKISMGVSEVLEIEKGL